MKQFTQQGFSIIEIMLASILALFLLAGVSEVYVSTKKTFLTQIAFAHIQENTRLAAHILSQTIRMAGDASCENNNYMINKNEAIHGYQNQLPEFLKNTQIVENTNVIVIGRCISKDNKLQFAETAYFVAKTSRKNKNQQPILSLYEKIKGEERRQELIPDINDMQILYGIKNSNNDIEKYLSATDINNWQSVKSVKITLTLNSTKAFNLYITLREPR